MFSDLSKCHCDDEFSLLLPLAGGTGSLTYITDTPVQCRLSQGLGSLTTVCHVPCNMSVFLLRVTEKCSITVRLEVLTVVELF